VSKGLLTPLNGVHDSQRRAYTRAATPCETATTHNARHQHAPSFRCLSASVPRIRELSLRSRRLPAGGGKRERTRYSRYAKATFRRDRRLNIRLSTEDLQAIQKRALAEGLPCQTLIASVLHKYATGRLNEI
jgi:hypothetical protein